MFATHLFAILLSLNGVVRYLNYRNSFYARDKCALRCARTTMLSRLCRVYHKLNMALQNPTYICRDVTGDRCQHQSGESTVPWIMVPCTLQWNQCVPSATNYKHCYSLSLRTPAIYKPLQWHLSLRHLLLCCCWSCAVVSPFQQSSVHARFSTTLSEQDSTTVII